MHKELVEACKKGDLEIVKRLIDHGVDFTDNDNLAITTAIENEHINIARFLIDSAMLRVRSKLILHYMSNKI